MYKCCIFNLDGTLINSIKAISYSCNLTLNKYNLGPIDEDLYKIFIGDGYSKLIERALIHWGDTNTDMKTGINSGMDSIGVTWGFRDRKELESFNPKYVIDHSSEIIDIVKSSVLVSN